MFSSGRSLRLSYMIECNAGSTYAVDVVERVDRASVPLQDPSFAKEDVAQWMVKPELIRVYSEVIA